MKISRLYSNRPELFPAIEFNSGLSVVLAEIRLPENRARDTHNLGKTTVGEIIDYCLMRKKDPEFFLFKHPGSFNTFTFYLEVSLSDGSYFTISRPVVPGTKASVKRTSISVPDASTFNELDWDHVGLSTDRAKSYIDGVLNLTALAPWNYRKLVGYLLRSQRDYLDVFQLGKFAGKHQDWKPFVAHLLGLDAEPVIQLYNKREELQQSTNHIKSLLEEWGPDDADLSTIDGLVSVKRGQIDEAKVALEGFNFNEADLKAKSSVVDELEVNISSLTEESYRNDQMRARLESALDEGKVAFHTREASKLFESAGVSLGDQLTKTFEQLVEFNRQITEERRSALEAQLREVDARGAKISEELPSLHEARAEALAFLRESESFAKLRSISKDVALLQGELSTLEARRDAASRINELRRNHRDLAQEFTRLQGEVEDHIAAVSADDSSHFGHFRTYFNEIVRAVLGQSAILAIRLNKEGGLEFTAEFVNESGSATSGDRGTSYKKLLCIAFDLAMLRTHLPSRFARFVLHDGAFEQLDPRKRKNLSEVFKEYENLGIQVIVTALDSDLEGPTDRSSIAIADADIVRLLHDEGEDGRLFKMPSW